MFLFFQIMPRVNLRCVVAGIGIAATFFLFFQIMFYILMWSPANDQTRVQPRNAHHVTQTLSPSHEKMADKCVGWDCNDNDDAENRAFHPRDIGRLKNRPPRKKETETNAPHEDTKLKLNQSDLKGKVNRSKVIEETMSQLRNQLKEGKQRVEAGINSLNEDISKLKKDMNVKEKLEDKDIVVPRGVLRLDGRKYMPDGKGQFTCLFSQVSIFVRLLSEQLIYMNVLEMRKS